MPKIIPDVSDTPVVSIPEAGALLGLSRSAAYRAAKSGHLPTVYLGERRQVVPTAALRKMLGLDVDALTAIELR